MSVHQDFTERLGEHAQAFQDLALLLQEHIKNPSPVRVLQIHNKVVRYTSTFLEFIQVTEKLVVELAEGAEIPDNVIDLAKFRKNSLQDPET